MDNTFEQSMNGSFIGVLRWHQFDKLWDILQEKQQEQWYIYAIGQEVPQLPVSGEIFVKVLKEIEGLIRKEHQEDYCGIVYTNSMDMPDFIKIYDPNNLGVVCGISKEKVLPGWVISKLKPVDLQANTLVTQQRKRWWQRIFGE